MTTEPTAVTPYYADGTVTIYHDDALEVLRHLPNASADAVITDPPYSSGGTYRGDRTAFTTGVKYTGLKRQHYAPDFEGDNRDQRSWGYWCALWLAQALRVTKPGGVLTVSADWRQLPTLTDAIQAGGWVWRGIAPWVKPDARPQFGRLRNAAEFIVWATRGPRPLVGDCLPGYWVASWPRNKIHQTEKPMEVMRDLVKLAPAEGVVLDPFAGGGTTGLAALAEGRRFIGIEWDARYVEATVDRLRRTRLQPADDGAMSLFEVTHDH